jgi:predicted membrane-bound spermidine synthase
LYYAFFALILLIVLSGVYLILRDSRLIRGFRFGYAVLSVLLYVILVGVFKPFHFNILRSDLEKAQPVVMIEGSTTSLSTVDLEGGGKSALLNNQLLFSSDQNGLKEQQIPAFLPVLLNSNIQSTLVIGFGMGTTAFMLEENGVKDIHITEFFPEILRFSADIFAEDNDDILTSSRVTITIEDAGSYLNRTGRMVDLITTGYAQLDQMPGIYTTEFYRLCFRHLTDSGLMCQVLPADGIALHEFKALIKSFAVVFRCYALVPYSERLLRRGQKHPETELCRLLTDFQIKQKGESGINRNLDLESLMAQILLEDRQSGNI